MTSKQLDNLVKIGQLKPHSPTVNEFNGLIEFGLTRLKDAQHPTISLYGRFDLAYNAAHSLALAALWWHGFRSENRYLVFQTLVHTVNLSAAKTRVFSKAHTARNAAEYEGVFEIDDKLTSELLNAAIHLNDLVQSLGKSENFSEV